MILSSVGSSESKIRRSPSLRCSENGANSEIKRHFQNSEASSPLFTDPIASFTLSRLGVSKNKQNLDFYNFVNFRVFGVVRYRIG